MITPLQLADSVGITLADAVTWGTPVPCDAAGIYIVATADDQDIGAQADVPIELHAVAELLHARPELRLDGRRPDTETLQARVATMWVPDASVLYIGLAGTSVRKRVGQYYRTPLGARGPHAGGWPLKTLAILDELQVHWAEVDDPKAAELSLLDAFASHVPAEVRAQLRDPDVVLPLANLRRSEGERKAHGISGARAPSHRRSSSVDEAVAPHDVPSSDEGLTLEAGQLDAFDRRRSGPAHGSQTSEVVMTQNVTPKDLEAGHIRLPKAAKALLPGARNDVDLVLRGLPMIVRYDPRNGPGRDRSGVLRIGTQQLASRVAVGERLVVTRQTNHVLLD